MAQKPQFIMNFDRINGYPIIQASSKEGVVTILLSTGSNVCIMDASFYFSNGGTMEMLAPTEPLEYFFGEREVFGKTLCNLMMGNTIFKVPIIIADMKAYFSAIIPDEDKQPSCILGSNFFHRWKIHIDYDNEMIYSYTIKS